uniref:Uncharacterized protein n=1 Tax=Panagrolaimus sp. ES5 TaxID=591445 RepID=A0AC34GVK7_9BILA
MPWSVQDYGCWYVSKELLIFIIFISANLLFAQNDNNNNDVSDYYGYTTGSSVKLKCPENGKWYIIGTQCFKIGTNNGTVQIVNFDDANALCFSPENNYSQPLNLPNWYKSVDLAKFIYSNLTNLPAAFQNTSSEIWTGFYFDMGGDTTSYCTNVDIPYFNCSLYPPLKVVTTGKIISLYTPLWAKGEPKIPSFPESAISYNLNYTNGDAYGWKVQRQALYLPTVCQTFTCFEDDFRCQDNSQCIPGNARCDDLTHCSDASDEANCPAKLFSKAPVFTDKFGVIHAPATSCIFDGNKFCEWHISQKPGTIIQLNFLDLKMLPDDELSVEGFATGENLKLSNNGPFTHLFVDNELRIRYRPSLHNIDNEKANGSIRGFQLQYSAEETTSCITKFDTWNGIITTPAQLYDGRKYRPLLDCRWVITKRGSTLLGVQIPTFDLAFGDWLKIYESGNENENEAIIGMFGHANSPPTAFATHLPYLIFEFHSEKNSPGAAGIVIDFQQTCINIFLNESFGQIESPGFQNEDNRNPFHCSWIIEVPCESEECGITFYFDVLNLTNKDSITIETNYEKILIDANSLPILSHQTKYHKAILQMHSTQKYFAAQISYSIDCPKPAYSNQVIAKFETFPHVYRSSVDYSCISSPHLIAKKGSCEKGGKWDTLPPDCESRRKNT